MKTTVSEKGQVTIPKSLRDSLGLAPGTLLDFTEEQGALVARRVVQRDPLDDLFAILPQTNVDAAITEMRGPAWTRELDERPRGHRRR